jgi:drug/metabolite transporter (DMT)-like permease
MFNHHTGFSSAEHNDMKVRPDLATPIAALVFTSAVCFFITTLIGVWSAYEAFSSLFRFGLFAVGLWAMFGIGWRGRHHPKTTLSSIGLGCALLAAAIGIAYLLSLTTNSGMVASSLIVLLPLGVSSIAWNRTRHHRTSMQIGIGASGIAVVALVLCFERTAWIGLCGGVLCAAFVYWRFNDKRTAHSLLYHVSDVVVILGILLFLGVYWQLLTNPNLDGWFKATPLGGALWKRVPLWRESLALIQDYDSNFAQN